MKIFTITCHDVYNYGASLQAYALQHYLAQNNHDVEIIDYIPDWKIEPYKIRWNMISVSHLSCLYEWRKVPGVRFIYRLKYGGAKLLTILNYRLRKKKFDCFKKTKLICTSTLFRNLEQLKQANLQADCIICGSDQIWNPRMKNGYDAVYYAQFLDIPRISYAASFGVSNLTEDDKSMMSPWLNSFSFISVREKTGLRLLHEMGIQCGVQVSDPVFLLTAEDWKQLSSGKYLIEDFIFVYNIGKLDMKIKQCAIELRKRTGKRIVAIEEMAAVSYADIRVKDAGPCEFVELLSKSAMVISNSFHATSFALIFNKPMYTFINNAFNSRVSDILRLVGLEARMNPSVDVDNDIPWESINDIIKNESLRSQQYLLEAICNK